MVDKNKLKGKIIERGYSVESLAKELNMDKSSLYRKLNGRLDFSIKEANKIVIILKLSMIEAYEIFFTKKVA